MNPWLVALAALVVGAVLGALGSIAFYRGRSGGPAGIAPREAAQEAEAKATEAREEAARAELQAKEAENVSPAEWINGWAAPRIGARDDADPSRGD